MPVNDDTIVVEKTCTTPGKAVGKCTVCKKENADMVIPASHEYYVAEETEATCIKPGRVSKICTECTEGTPGHKIYEETPATGHTKPVASKVHTYLADPQITSDENGNEIYVEDKDGNIQYTTTDESITVSKITASALNKKLCTQGIVEVYTCEDCGKTITETIYDVVGHNFITRVPAKCKTPGTKVCTVCQTKETIPATGHNLEGGYVVPTSTTTAQNNQYRVDCKDCGLVTVTLDRATKTITDDIGATWNVTITPATANKPESIRIGKIPCTTKTHNLNGAIVDTTNNKVTCPVCDTELAATYDADEKTVTVETIVWNVSVSGTTVTVGKKVCDTCNYTGAKLTAGSKSLTCATCGKEKDVLASNFATTAKVVEISSKKYNVVESNGVYSVGAEHTAHDLSGKTAIISGTTGTVTCDCGTVNLTEYTADTEDATKATVKDDKNVVWNVTVGDNEGTPTYTIGSKVQ